MANTGQAGKQASQAGMQVGQGSKHGLIHMPGGQTHRRADTQAGRHRQAGVMARKTRFVLYQTVISPSILQFSHLTFWGLPVLGISI